MKSLEWLSKFPIEILLKYCVLQNKLKNTWKFIFKWDYYKWETIGLAFLSIYNSNTDKMFEKNNKSMSCMNVLQAQIKIYSLRWCVMSKMSHVIPTNGLCLSFSESALAYSAPFAIMKHFYTSRIWIFPIDQTQSRL